MLCNWRWRLIITTTVLVTFLLGSYLAITQGAQEENQQDGLQMESPKRGSSISDQRPAPNRERRHAAVESATVIHGSANGRYVDFGSVRNLLSEKSSARVRPQRLVHLDLKGAPPKIAYYEKFFPFVKRLGATGLLVEYEDMFPFWGPLEAIKAKNAYTRQEVERLVQLAKQSQLEVIPLIQTFGHLEFVLKLSEFQELREAMLFPQALCPSKNGSLELVRHMVDQVVELHPGIHWLHIGCDEVFHLGICRDCQGRMYAQQERRGSYAGKHFLFVDHVRTVATYVKDVHKLQPIIWDDMLRNVAETQLVAELGGGLIEPMVWVYVSQIYRFVDSGVWRKYARAFPAVWAAGAFKGAFGPTMFAVNGYRHLQCTLGWLEVMKTQGPLFVNGFQGYVLTGWQRYDHFATLCELLPAGVPSLAANLMLLNHTAMDDALLKKVSKELTCNARFRQPTMVSLAKSPFLWEYSRCTFPGQPFFRLLRTFKQLRSRIRQHVQTVTEEQAWLATYNVNHNFSSPQRIMEAITWHTVLLQSAEQLREEIKTALGQVFDRYTVSEWLEQNMRALLESMRKLDADAHALMARETWPSRPLPSDYDDDDDF